MLLHNSMYMCTITEVTGYRNSRETGKSLGYRHLFMHVYEEESVNKRHTDPQSLGI